jgi:hypothetical protein
LPAYTGRIPDLARDLRKELRRAHYEKFAEALSAYPFGSPFEKYRDCYDLLGLMMKFRCTKGAGMGAVRRFAGSGSAAVSGRFGAAGNAMNSRTAKIWIS